MVKNKFCKLTRKKQTAHRNWVKDLVKLHFIEQQQNKPISDQGNTSVR